MNDAPIIIAGSGSSGTNLLRAILNRSDYVAVGPELSLLNKAVFFNQPYQWIKKNSKRIIHKGYCTDGWILYKETFIDNQTYGWSREELNDLLAKSSSFAEVIELFFKRFLEQENKTIWAEKTPSNIYCFEHLQKIYPEARLIHVVRDGRDVITSFIKRGMSPFFATMLWIYNTSFALKHRNQKYYYEIRYEDLVENPSEEVNRLCHFLGIPFDLNLTHTESNDKENAKDTAWNNAPNQKISSSSIGKHHTYLSPYHKYAILKTHISNAHVKKYQLVTNSFIETMTMLGYPLNDFKKLPDVGLRKKLHFQRSVIQDILYRYYFYLFNDLKIRKYPASLRKLF